MTIAQGGTDAFYRGDIAEKVCDYLRMHGGLLTPDDFAANESTWVSPITSSYRGHTACQLPPNTQGFAALEMLGILDGLDVAALGDSTAAYVHTLAEAARLAFQDRDRYLTDPDFVDVPLDRLLSPEHAAELRARLDPTRKGRPEAAPTGGGTCYLCAVDRDGNAVSLIQSVFFDFGSAVVAGDTGATHAESGIVLLARSGPPESAGAPQAHVPHADPGDAAGGWRAVAGVRHHGRRGPAADPGRHRDAHR